MLAELGLLLLAACLAAAGFPRLPRIVAPVLGSIIIGPTILGLVSLNQGSQVLGIAELSAVLVMLMAGTHVHLDVIRIQWRASVFGALHAVATTALLFVVVGIVALLIPALVPVASSAFEFSLLVALVMAPGAVIIATALFQERSIAAHSWAASAIFALAISEVVFLATAGAVVGHGIGLWIVGALLLALLLAVLLVWCLEGDKTLGAREAFLKVSDKFGAALQESLRASFEPYKRRLGTNPVDLLTFLAMGGVLSAWLTHSLGLTEILGPFLFGMLFASRRELKERDKKAAEVVLRGWLLPIYFGSLGLRYDFLEGLDVAGFVLVFLIVVGSYATRRTVANGLGALLGLDSKQRDIMRIAFTPLGLVSIIVADLAVRGELLPPFVRYFTTPGTNSDLKLVMTTTGEAFVDNCLIYASPAGTDVDGDGTNDDTDNCTGFANVGQSDLDSDGVGDVCDPDIDGDSVLNGIDCGPNNNSIWQTRAYADADGDGVRNTTTVSNLACHGATPNGFTSALSDVDNCLVQANSSQSDYDLDGQGDTCDSDRDGDGVTNGSDCAPLDFQNHTQGTYYLDPDSDGSPNSSSPQSLCNAGYAPGGYTTTSSPLDNCPALSNADQSNNDGDSAGDACDTDDDNDDISDGQEVSDGTDPLDRGSGIEVLSTTVCGEWNGFFQGTMWNYFEHVNLTNQTLNFSTELFNLAGQSTGSIPFQVGPGAQFDYAVHALGGRVQQSYGRVCSTHDGSLGDADGRMVYYLPRINSFGAIDGFQFAFAMPMTNGRRGEQFVTYNTFHPSFRPADHGNLITNWIQLTNLSGSAGTGKLHFYEMNGSQLEEVDVSLAAGARRDISAHQFGLNKVGVVRWAPNDSSNRYQLRNVRYLYDNPGAIESFSTAFQLAADSGAGGELVLPLDTRSGSAILELVNTLDQSTPISLTLYDQAGVERYAANLTLGAYESRHIITEEADKLGANQRGVAVVQGASRESLLAIAMHYVRAGDGAIEYMYGVPGRRAQGLVSRGSYNTNIGQDSELILLNPTDSEQEFQITVVSQSGAVRLQARSDELGLSSSGVPAKGSMFIEIGNYSGADDYGVVTIQADHSAALVPMLRRVRAGDYVIPTPLR